MVSDTWNRISVATLFYVFTTYKIVKQTTLGNALVSFILWLFVGRGQAQCLNTFSHFPKANEFTVGSGKIRSSFRFIFYSLGALDCSFVSSGKFIIPTAREDTFRSGGLGMKSNQLLSTSNWRPPLSLSFINENKTEQTRPFPDFICYHQQITTGLVLVPLTLWTLFPPLTSTSPYLKLSRGWVEGPGDPSSGSSLSDLVRVWNALCSCLPGCRMH